MASIQEFEKVLDQSDTSVASFHSRSPLQKIQHFLHSTPAAVPAIVLIVSIIIFGLTIGGRFFSSYTLTLILQQIAVVGILGAALYNPVWTSAVLSPRDFAVALAGFLLLTVWKLPPWIVVALLALAGAILQLT